MIENIHRENSVGFEGEAYLKSFDEDIAVYISAKEQIPYAEKCVAAFDGMDESMCARLKKYVYRYYRDYADGAKEEELGMPVDAEEEEILDYVCPTAVIVDPGCRKNVIEYHVECECDWEIENGLEITVSGTKILYVGSFEDLSPGNKADLKKAGFYRESDRSHLNYADAE